MTSHTHRVHSSVPDPGTLHPDDEQVADEAAVLLPSHHCESSSPVHRGHPNKPFTSLSVQAGDHTVIYGTGWGHSTAASSGSSNGGSSGASHTKAVLCLCGAHALARWGWRTWEFAVVSWALGYVACAKHNQQLSGCGSCSVCRCVCRVHALWCCWVLQPRRRMLMYSMPAHQAH